MKRLRVGIIGQGRSGNDIHGHTMSLLPRYFDIVAVVDPLKVRRDKSAAKFQCETYKDHRALLKRDDLDLVVNATPNHLHVPIALELLKTGHNVLVEKPLARKVKDVDRLVAAADKAGVVFAVFQQSRFAPYFEQVRKVIDSGVLGRIVQVKISFSGFARRWDQQTLTAWDGGNLMNTGPHPLDQALRFMDLPLDTVPEVFCCMDNAHFFGDAEGHVNLTMRAPDAPIIDLEISSCKAYPTHVYQVYGTQGGLKASMTDVEWRYYNPAEAPRRRATTVPIHNADNSPGYCGETLKWTTRRWKVPPSKRELFDFMSMAFYRMLHKHITVGAPLAVTVDQVRQQVAVIEACHRQNPHIWAQKK